MKKFGILMAFLSASFLFQGCETDDNSVDQPNPKLLIGTWTITEVTQEDGTFSGTYNNLPVPAGTASFTGQGKNFNNAQIAIEEPDSFKSSGNFTNTVTVSIIGQSIAPLQIPVELNQLLNGSKWESDGKTLTIEFNGVKQVADIIELSNNTLKLEMETSQDIDTDNLKGTAKATSKITLTK